MLSESLRRRFTVITQVNGGAHWHALGPRRVRVRARLFGGVEIEWSGFVVVFRATAAADNPSILCAHLPETPSFCRPDHRVWRSRLS